MFPALGFGARIPPNENASHEFFLNLTSDPYCDGIDGVLAAYHQTLNGVELYGPTNFSPVINHVANFARAYQNDPTNYFVLLIITDGIITDLDATKSAVISASSLPLSIIIVGVGSEDFTAMDDLDSDDELLSHNGRTAQRDIVQFVEMQKFVSGRGSHVTWNKEMLAREVLFEIPDQLVGYMKKKGFKPGEPQQRNVNQHQLAYATRPAFGSSKSQSSDVSQMYPTVQDAPPAYSPAAPSGSPTYKKTPLWSQY
jgi:hypothetical protein